MDPAPTKPGAEPGRAAAPVPAAEPPAVPPVARPHGSLLVYYALTSLLLGPLFFVLLLPLWFKYRTLRYELDDEGVSMRWGVLFRREIHLTYARIQDIHLTSNVVERWLGLGKVQVQTASGSSKAEMVIEGRQDFEAIRDFLYRRMRGMGEERGRAGARVGAAGPAAAVPGSAGAALSAAGGEELATVLLAVAHELRAVRHALQARAAGERRAAGEGAPAALGDRP